jgi:hypothetical protein
MIIDFYCPGHFRPFTTTGGRTSYGMEFCSGCRKKPLKTIQKRMEQFLMKLIDPKTWSIIRKREGKNVEVGSLISPKRRTYDVMSSCSLPYYQAAHADFSGRLLIGLCLAAIIIFNIDTLQAVPLDTLRAPMTSMKKEVWSYMYVVKVAAAIVGGVMSVVQQNLMPLGVGGGIAAGIHFFDGVIGDGSAALIG